MLPAIAEAATNYSKWLLPVEGTVAALKFAERQHVPLAALRRDYTNVLGVGRHAMSAPGT
jgi:hypothetical protein